MLIQSRHEIGKLANLVNPNHRHDEEHEKETDEKRENIGQSHRFHSFAPERPGNNIKWYVDGRDYCWVSSHVSIEIEERKLIGVNRQSQLPSNVRRK
jgi:phospholipase D1/2